MGVFQITEDNIHRFVDSLKELTPGEALKEVQRTLPKVEPEQRVWVQNFLLEGPLLEQQVAGLALESIGLGRKPFEPCGAPPTDQATSVRALQLTQARQTDLPPAIASEGKKLFREIYRTLSPSQRSLIGAVDPHVWETVFTELAGAPQTYRDALNLYLQKASAWSLRGFRGIVKDHFDIPEERKCYLNGSPPAVLRRVLLDRALDLGLELPLKREEIPLVELESLAQHASWLPSFHHRAGVRNYLVIKDCVWSDHHVYEIQGETAVRCEQPPPPLSEAEWIEEELKKRGRYAERMPRPIPAVTEKVSLTQVPDAPLQIPDDRLVDVEHNMRPGVLSEAGFLAEGENLAEVIEHDDQTARRLAAKHGISGNVHTETARWLIHLIETADQGGGSAIVDNEGGRLEVTVFPTMGAAQKSPLGDKITWNRELHVTNLDTGQEAKLSNGHPYLIGYYAIYQTGPYRTGPEALLRLRFGDS
ncbi:hypothetical protein ACFL6C_01205 [Myxococcota bacterium]